MPMVILMIMLRICYGSGFRHTYGFDLVSKMVLFCFHYTALNMVMVAQRGKARLGKQLGCKSENHIRIWHPRNP